MEYIVLPSRVKENIILQSPQDISGYMVTVYTENLSARLLENREIHGDICSDCGTNKRPETCIMNNSRISITEDTVLCDECKQEILAHLRSHDRIE